MKKKPNEPSRPAPAAPVELARDLGLFDASMIGIGATIGAGIFVLTGLACGEAGPAALLAFLFNGFVAALTAMSYAELSAAKPEAGGGYSFVRRSMSAPLAFLSGWMLWFAYTVACALYARGFAGYFLEFLHEYWTSLYTGIIALVGFKVAAGVGTLLVCLLFIGVNLVGAALTGKAEDAVTMAKIVVLALFVVFGLVHIAGHPQVALQNFTPFFPKGFLPVLTSMGLVFIAFEGYDLIATASEEIKDPARNIPRAIFITLAVPVVIYLLVILVSLGAVDPRVAGIPEGQMVWQWLGEKQETAIVFAARAFMPGIGVVLIVTGGLFSTMSALNASVLASSRVAFSMGRDRMLPPVFGLIHPVRRVPHVAILITGAILLAMATVLPLKAVGSAASLLFLLSFTLANWAAIILRVRDPKASRGFRIPLFPVPPVLGIIACLLLAVYQYTFSPEAWFVSVGWLVLGLVVYAFYIRRLEREEEQVLSQERPQRPVSEYRVLVPVANPATTPELIRLACAIAKRRNGDLIALGVVRTPKPLPLRAGRALAREYHDRTSLVQRAVSLARDQGVQCYSLLKAARSVSQGILTTIEEEKCDLVVMGWRGWTVDKQNTTVLGHTLDPVVGSARCDVLVYKSNGHPLDSAERLMVGTTASPHCQLAVELAPLLAHEFGASVEYVHIIKKGTEMDPKTVERYLSHRGPVRGKEDLERRLDLRVEEAESTAKGLVNYSREHDLLIIGAAREGVVPQLLFGVKSHAVAKLSPASVLLVKARRKGARSWFSRMFLPDSDTQQAA